MLLAQLGKKLSQPVWVKQSPSLSCGRSVSPEEVYIAQPPCSKSIGVMPPAGGVGRAGGSAVLEVVFVESMS
jgi:hypothetical protein